MRGAARLWLQVMLSRFTYRCQRFARRVLWLACCLACLACSTLMFLSLSYLEDHHGRIPCGEDRKQSAGSHGAFLRFQPDYPPQDQLSIKSILKENIELKKALRSLAGLTPRNSRRDRTVLRKPWLERSLKYFAREAPRVQDSLGEVNYPGATSMPETSTFLRGNVLDCKQIERIRIRGELGQGYTKLTQTGSYDGQAVAVKSVGLNSHDVRKCTQEKRAKLATDCLLFSRYKVMKELLLYQQLDHPNVIKIAVGLARLVEYFSDSPLGSLVIRDFQLIQFVLVSGEIKLSDLDDVGNEGQSCRSNRDCTIGSQKVNVTLPCVDGCCQGYNENWNLYNLERFYFKMFLLPGAPDHVASDLENIENRAAMLKYSSKSLVRDLEAVLVKLRTGRGLRKDDGYEARRHYRTVPHADFPGYYDYQCDHSISMINCQSLVFNEREAMKQCDEEEQCKAFVMSFDKTWIGYRWAFFKNNSTNMVFSAKNAVYIKVS